MSIQQLFKEKLSPVFGPYSENICSYYFSYQKYFSKQDSIEQIMLNGIFFLVQYDLNRLLAGVPVQYVVGLIEVMGCEFLTTPAALIPRPETEELINLVLKEHTNEEELKVIDIGTGSGIIPISLKKHKPNWQMFGIDIATNAINLAKWNALNLKAEINFIQQTIFNFHSEEKFDIIISNPPYIPHDECLKLDESVRNFEPILALEVPNEDPLLFYKAIINFALTNLKQNGCIYLEIHQNLGEEMLNLIRPYFTNCFLKKDFAQNDRFVLASQLKS